MDNQPVEYIEDVRSRAINSNAPLSAAALAEGGLVPALTYIRTRRSANAQRVESCREKAASKGLRQLNVVVPVEAHPAIKAFAKGLQQGRSVAEAAQALLAGEGASGMPRATAQAKDVPQAVALERLAAQLAHMNGWRRWIARMLGLI